MGLLWLILQGKWYMWRLTAGDTTKMILLLEDNYTGGIPINNLDISTYAVQLHIFQPSWDPLRKITKVDNRTAEGWMRQDIIILEIEAGPLFQESTWLLRKEYIYSMVNNILSLSNKYIEVKYILLHLTVSKLKCHLNTMLKNTAPYKLRLITRKENHWMLMMIHTNNFPQEFLLQRYRRITLLGRNGILSSITSAYPKTPEISNNLFPSFIFFLIRFTLESFTPKDTPFRSTAWINNFSLWVKYLQQ